MPKSPVLTKDFNPHKNYEPNDVQAEFIRLAAQKYWYLGLGDQNHLHAQIQCFAFSKKVMQALANAGTLLCCTESYTTANYVAGIKSDNLGTYKKFRYKTAKRSFGGDWLNKKEKKKLRDVFEEAVRSSPEIDFADIDKRNSFSCMMKTLSLLSRLPLYYITLLVAATAFRTMDDRAHKTAEILIPHGPFHNFLEIIGDDRETAKAIKNFNQKIAIFMGSAHFNQRSETLSGPAVSLRSLLTSDNKSLCVMEIYKDEEYLEYLKKLKEKKLSETEYRRRTEYIGPVDPDAILFVTPSKKNPHGIIIFNPELQPLYEEAVKNVKAGLTISSPSSGINCRPRP